MIIFKLHSLKARKLIMSRQVYLPRNNECSSDEEYEEYEEYEDVLISDKTVGIVRIFISMIPGLYYLGTLIYSLVICLILSISMGPEPVTIMSTIACLVAFLFLGVGYLGMRLVKERAGKKVISLKKSGTRNPYQPVKEAFTCMLITYVIFFVLFTVYHVAFIIVLIAFASTWLFYPIGAVICIWILVGIKAGGYLLLIIYAFKLVVGSSMDVKDREKSYLYGQEMKE